MTTGDRPTSGMDRRRALELMGAAFGGVLLTTYCGEGGGASGGAAGASSPGGATLPNGYRFVPVFSAGGDVLPAVTDVTPGVLLNGRGEILLYGQRGEGYGLYELTLDLGGEKPRVRSARAVVETGATLSDGRRVGRIAATDVNDRGSIATVLGTSWDGSPGTQERAIPAVYLERGKKALEPIARFDEPADREDRRYGGAFGDIALRDDDQVLIVARYMEPRSPGEAIFLAPPEPGPTARLLFGTGDALPGTRGAAAEQLGLIDAAGDRFITQATGAYPDETLSAMERGEIGPSGGTSVVSGAVSDPKGTLSLLAGSPRFGTSGDRAGEVYMGPRVGAGGERAFVTHLTDERMVLWFGERRVAAAGEASPAGASIQGISAPVLGPPGLVFYLLLTDRGPELCASNGAEHRKLIRSGDRTEDGRTVTRIQHGFHSAQADPQGRIVFHAEFEQGPPALVLGLPV